MVGGLETAPQILKMLKVRSIRNTREIPDSLTVVGDSFIEVSRYDFWKCSNDGNFEIKRSCDGEVIMEGVVKVEEYKIRRSVKGGWDNCAIAINMGSGLGDSLIISSVAQELKKRPCYVVGITKVKERGEFFKSQGFIDDYILKQDFIEIDFDICLEPLLGLLTREDEGHFTLVDEDYYSLAWSNVGISGRISHATLKLDTNIAANTLRELPSIRPLIAIHAAATNPDRRWSEDNWKKLSRILVDKGFGIVWLGSHPKWKVDIGFDELPHQRRLASLGSGGDIGEQLKILNMCNYFIGTDSAWLHFAGCLNLPSTAIFCATHPKNVIARYGNIQSLYSFGEKALGVSSGLCKEYRENSSKITPEMVLQSIPPRLFEMANLNVDKNKVSWRPVQPSARQNILCLSDKDNHLISGLSTFMYVSYINKGEVTPSDYDIILCPEGHEVEELAGAGYSKIPTIKYRARGKNLKLSVQRWDWETSVSSVEDLRKAVNFCAGKTWIDRVYYGEVQFVREDGLGDLILASPVYRKLREFFPEANLSAVVKGAMVDIIEESEIFDQIYDLLRQEPPLADLAIYASYFEGWERTPPEHGGITMGGDGESLFVDISDRRLDKVKQEIAEFADGNKVVGIMPWQAPSSLYKCKQLSDKAIKGVIRFCKKKGYKVVQLGAPFEKKLKGVDERFLYKHVLDSIASFKAVDCVVTLDCYAQHACKAIGQNNCVVVWGGSGTPEFLGYDCLENVITESTCRCWASVCALTYKTEKCCGGPKSGLESKDVTRCMEEVSVDKINKGIEKCLSLE